jgi:hypothetical protein
MTKAFDLLLADFKLVDRKDPVVTMLAKLVIELVRSGERNPKRCQFSSSSRTAASIAFPFSNVRMYGTRRTNGTALDRHF